MRELKRTLRKELIARRKAMKAEQKLAADLDIFEQVKPYLDKASSVFTYASTDIEVDTRRVMEYCWERNIPVALPVSGDEELTFYPVRCAEELHRGRFGIDEPPITLPAKHDEGTLCIVPALCADDTGARLGYGRGYYDRFLSGFHGTSVILCYRDFKLDVPTEPHDIKADLAIFNR